MKKAILIITLFLCINAFSQPNGKHDADLHLLAGAAIGGGTYHLFNQVFKGKHKFVSFLASIGSAFTAGHLIEQLDKRAPNGVFNHQDIKWTAIGGVTGSLGSFVINLNIENNKQKEKIKKLEEERLSMLSDEEILLENLKP